jgi:CreA protein
MTLRRAVLAATLAVGLPSAVPATATADVVGKIGTDWTGNDIIVEAIEDPKVQGVTCHIAYFQRGLIDRLRQGNWFEDPSNSAISCQQTGPITVGDIELDRNGEEVFAARRSLLFKKLVVNRIYDKTTDTLVYVSHTREIQQGSAKMAIATVPLYNQNPTWTKGKP